MSFVSVPLFGFLCVGAANFAFGAAEGTPTGIPFCVKYSKIMAYQWTPVVKYSFLGYSGQTILLKRLRVIGKARLVLSGPFLCCIFSIQCSRFRAIDRHSYLADSVK